MSAMVEDSISDEFKNCRGIDEINEFIYKLILKNKHLEFVEMLDPDNAVFYSFKDNKYFIPQTNVVFSYEDVAKGYSIYHKMEPDLNTLADKRTKFSLDNEFSDSNIHSEISLKGYLTTFHEKALKEANRFRSDFLMVLEENNIRITERVQIDYKITFDFNNNIIDSSISFRFNYINTNSWFLNFKLSKDNDVSCGIAFKTNYKTFLVGSTSKHLMLHFLLQDMGIENDLETRNHTSEEISNYMLLIDMKRI